MSLRASRRLAWQSVPLQAVCLSANTWKCPLQRLAYRFIDLIEFLTCKLLTKMLFIHHINAADLRSSIINLAKIVLQMDADTIP